MVLEKKGSARVEAGQRRVLDEATRQRRLTRQLEALEKDNFQDDPLSSLPPPGPTARLPAFSETEEPEKKKRKTRGDHFKQRFRKNFTTLLEEENLSEKPEPNYLSAAAPPSSLPPRHFCCVCGFPSHYTCTTCGGRYCSECGRARLSPADFVLQEVVELACHQHHDKPRSTVAPVKFQNKLLSHSDFSDSSVISSATSQSSPFSPSSPVSSPISPTFSSPPSSSSSSSSSPCYDSRQAYLSLSSPELLSELKESKTWSLRHVPAHNGMTTVFSGRGRRGGGRQVSGSSPSTQLANQKT